MKVLVIGGGGREHALVWKISQSNKVDKIYCAPGNGGIRNIAECVDIRAEDVEGLLEFAFDHKIDLTVVGPEAPLTLGIVDRFNAVGLRIFGPDAKGAILEGSKAYSKDFMLRNNIPTALYKVYTDSQRAKDDIDRFGFPVVIKADGLASGKGVIIANNKDEAIKAISYIMDDKTFGKAGIRVVIEEFLIGKETSILAFSDGKSIVPMVSAQDYKRALDEDQGVNTGGMGAISPAFYYTEELREISEDIIIKKTLDALKDEGINYHGILYFGLMLTDKGPKVLEFNVRFGDPEIEAVLMRLENDIVDIFEACIDGKLEEKEILWSKKPAVCVVVASGGYPGEFVSGHEITGYENEGEEAIIFHGGTKYVDGKIISNGGRVLVVSALGDTIEEARNFVYERIKQINFTKMQYRSDIGKS